MYGIMEITERNHAARAIVNQGNDRRQGCSVERKWYDGIYYREAFATFVVECLDQVTLDLLLNRVDLGSKVNKCHPLSECEVSA